MIIPIPFNTDKHVMLQKTVRRRSDKGALINMPRPLIGQKCIVLLSMDEDEEETEKWFEAVTKPYKG